MNEYLVLVVEDDKPIRNLITTTLKMNDYRFITAVRGNEAIMLSASHKPDIIILDLGLPDIDGVEVIEHIRTWSDVPILDDEEIHLTPIEYKLLCLLAKNVGKVLTHKYIIQSVWGTPADNSEASLRVFMATLRKKLSDSSQALIQTHIGIGYRMMKL